MSNSQGEPSSSSQQSASSAQQRIQKRPPFANLPTIKILTPPQGSNSRATDEWCFTYCTQNVHGRTRGRDPECRSMCIRKVFPHEVRNIISYKAHRATDAEGKAHYPLPTEGQPANLPRLFGGKAPDGDVDDSPSPSPPNKNWEEGLYFWTSSSPRAAIEKVQMMSADLERQQAMSKVTSRRAEVWQDYQDRLKQGTDKEELAARYGQISCVPTPPFVTEAERAKSMLVRIPPEWPSLSERIGKLLEPSKRMLSIAHESIMSGEQRDFAYRVRDKAFTAEPWALAQKTLSRAYERWRDREPADEDDSKKGST